MKKNVLVFGTIAGVIVSLYAIAIVVNSSLEGMWLCYGSMIVAFSLIFVGVKNFRDNYNDGFITFGKAFKIGLYIALIASSMYVVTWLVEYYVFVPDFMDKYTAHVIEQAKSHGASLAEINKQKAQMATYADML
jgi:ethanolamine transporter EutH